MYGHLVIGYRHLQLIFGTLVKMAKLLVICGAIPSRVRGRNGSPNPMQPSQIVKYIMVFDIRLYLLPFYVVTISVTKVQSFIFECINSVIFA